MSTEEKDNGQEAIDHPNTDNEKKNDQQKQENEVATATESNQISAEETKAGNEEQQQLSEPAAASAQIEPEQKKGRRLESQERIIHFQELRNDIPNLQTGDIARVSYRVIEGGKERIQAFEGVIIAFKNSGFSRSVTVRKTSFGISVERIFPLHSKLVQKIEVKKHSRVRRAKLYYLRELKGKAAKLKELR
jgi:large subunit ribosomal protein L19